MTRLWRLSLLALALLAGGCAAGPGSSSRQPVTAKPWPTSTDIQTIRALIESRAKDSLTSIGVGDTTVVVGLRAGAVDLAKQLVDAYGDLVDVTVGLLSYPSGTAESDPCAVPWTFADHATLRASVEMSDRQVTSGSSFDATIAITNIGSAPFELETSSSLEVHLFRAGGTKPVGAFELPVAGTGLRRTIEAGASTSIPGYGGTASCDISLGYALPPGPYAARALVDFTRGVEGGQGPLVFWSDPVEVEIVEASTP